MNKKMVTLVHPLLVLTDNVLGLVSIWPSVQFAQVRMNAGALRGGRPRRNFQLLKQFSGISPTLS